MSTVACQRLLPGCVVHIESLRVAGDIRRQWDALEQANARGGVGEREPVRHTNLGPVREGKGGAKRRKPKHGRG